VGLIFGRPYEATKMLPEGGPRIAQGGVRRSGRNLGNASPKSHQPRRGDRTNPHQMRFDAALPCHTPIFVRSSIASSQRRSTAIPSCQSLLASHTSPLHPTSSVRPQDG
jgi:hypothetical protein